jgi:hypothetical protein
MGCFDIKGLSLISPNMDATVPLPVTFTWEKRVASPNDSYQFMLYDSSDFDPYFETSPLELGYVDHFTLASLPPGFTYDVSYGWEIWIRQADGAYGIVLETRKVKFSP